MPDIRSRKADHLDLCSTDQVAFRGKSTLLEEVQLVHDALPELDIEAIDLSTTVADKTLRGPLVIAAMTGGIDRAEAVNKGLASVAQELGLAFGFGSMRPLLQNGIRLGYEVRDVAPDAVLLGNLGVVQARDASDQQLVDLVGTTGVDALCIHLNPAQEVVQDGGDTDFRGGLDTFQRVVELLDVPIIAKETGCGLSRRVGKALVRRGVRWVDTGGAGGTSWVGVETLRARAATERLGELYWDWGIPTAASVLQLQGLGLGIIATGGVSSGLDIARALALGASAGGMARPFLKAWNAGGQAGALQAARELLHEVRVAMLLSGCPDVPSMQKAHRLLGPNLERWEPA
ncbi:MAG: type 2 isopentenyl-diphosphate Delta-isomerase [Alphaproteobacteria bacterium]|nr:type 2 isopentenyl-diphosphate Delta-isomerase [Alphaproteobacteria bacterium]